MSFTSKNISATCIEYSFGSKIDKDINSTVLHVYNLLPTFLNFKEVGILDIVPSYTALSIYFDSTCKLLKDLHAYDAVIKKALKIQYTHNINEHIVHVEYNGEDLEEVCKTLNLSKNEFINLHTSSYSIAMIGFREYFPYLLGLNEQLNIARRSSPRVNVKKGSVAIAAGQTGIYPEDLPGGWHIIGHTDFDNFQRLKPSDIITFRNKDDIC